MDKEMGEIVRILGKIFPILIQNPDLMVGCDISSEEIEKIRETGKTLS